MKAFKVIGEIEMKKRTWQKFSKELTADDEKSARDKILADLGSRHKKKQRSIRIDTIQELQPGDVTNPVLRHRLGVD